MVKSKENYRIKLQYRIRESVVSYEFRKSDWMILEVIYMNVDPITIDEISHKIISRGKNCSHTKIRRTLKMFSDCFFLNDCTKEMKKKYQPKWGVNMHKNIKAQSGAKIMCGKTNLLKYYELTEKGIAVHERFSEASDKLILSYI